VKFPLKLARTRIERVRVTIKAQNVNRTVCDRGSAVHIRFRLEFPYLTAFACIDGVEGMIVAADIHNAVCNNWR